MSGDYWSRRGFLTTLVTSTIAGAASLWYAPRLMALQQEFKDIPAIQPRRAKRPRKVIVLGAGLAGLCSAFELTHLGHDVTILEARNRPGGRVCTLREGFSDGLKVEAGAQILYNAHRYSVHYCMAFNIPLQPVFPGMDFRSGQGRTSSIVYLNGKTIWGSDVMRNPALLPFDLTTDDVSILKGGPPVGSLYFLDSAARSYGGDDLERLSEREIPQLQDLRDLDQVPIGEFLRSRGVSKGMMEIIGRSLDRYYNAGSLEHISTLYVLMDEAIGLRSGHQFRILGGNDKFPLAFAERLARRILYGTPVVRLEQDLKEVRVTYLQGNVRETISGDYVVCALPLPTLRLVETNPDFNPMKARAIRETPYASLHKIFLQCRRRYWEDEGWNGGAWTDLPMGILGHQTNHQPGTRGILNTYTTAPAALEIGAMSDQRQRETTLEQISRFSPGIRKHVENHRIWFWDAEEWNRGGYVVYHAGQMTTFLPELVKPEGRIHFAGEHTSLWHAYMNGALESGYRCAAEVHSRAESEV